jgi:hypothetical protein
VTEARTSRPRCSASALFQLQSRKNARPARGAWADLTPLSLQGRVPPERVLEAGAIAHVHAFEVRQRQGQGVARVTPDRHFARSQRSTTTILMPGFPDLMQRLCFESGNRAGASVGAAGRQGRRARQPLRDAAGDASPGR